MQVQLSGKQKKIIVMCKIMDDNFSMIPTTEMEARHPIPGCSYSIHASSINDIEAGRPAGAIIKYARVGDRVLHQWHCDDRKETLVLLHLTLKVEIINLIIHLI